MIYLNNSSIRINKNERPPQAIAVRSYESTPEQERMYHYDIVILDLSPEAYIENRLVLEDILKTELQKPFENFSWSINENLKTYTTQNDHFFNTNRNTLGSLLDLVYHKKFGSDIDNKTQYIQQFLSQVGQPITPGQLLKFLVATDRINFEKKDLDTHSSSSKLRGFLEIVNFLNVPRALNFPDKSTEGIILSNLAKTSNYYRYASYLGPKQEEIAQGAYEKLVEYFFQQPATQPIIEQYKKSGYTCGDLAALGENLIFLKLLFQYYPDTAKYFTKKKLSEYQFRNPEVQLFMSSHLEKQKLDQFVNAIPVKNQAPTPSPARKFKL